MSDEKIPAWKARREKAEAERREIREASVEHGSYLALNGNGSYHNKNYLVISTKKGLEEFLVNHQIPATIVLGDDFPDATASQMLDVLLGHAEAKKISLKSLRLFFECYELELRAQLRARFELFRDTH